MLKTTLIIHLLLATVVLSSCSKSERDPHTATESEFTIEGMHDLILDTPMGESTISFNISQSAGTLEPVTLSVVGTPSGIRATLDKSSGTPSFSTSIRFKQHAYKGAGTFPISITAKSASMTRTATINLTVPNLNGWIVDSIAYNKAHFTIAPRSSAPEFYELSINTTNPNYSGVWGLFKGTIPVADGTYAYNIIGSDDMITMRTTEVVLGCFVHNRFTAEAKSINNQMAVLTIKDGKYSFTLSPTIVVEYDTGDTLILAVNASQ